MKAQSHMHAGSLEVALGLTNVLGRAEEIDLSAEVGMNNLTEFSVSVNKPRLAGRPINSTFGIYQKRRSHKQYSSYSEETRGGTTTFYGWGRHASLHARNGAHASS